MSYPSLSAFDGGGFDDYETGASVDGGGFEEPGRTALEKMRAFVESYPYADVLGELSIDYTDRVPNCGGLFPEGQVEVRRTCDVLGNVTVESQLNFALYTVFEKSPGEDAGATYNAEWLMSFQEWVQERSALGLAPTFGDEPRAERVTAGNGQLYDSDEEGWAVYVIQISASYRKTYGRS